MSYDQYSLCLELATTAHAGQTRRDKVTPYIVHPKAVAMMLPARFKREKCVALLHDVLEDTVYQAADLLAAGVDTEVVKAVRILTRAEQERYFDYIGRIATTDSPIDCVMIKIADICHNLSCGNIDFQEVKKYWKALNRLRG